MARLTLWGMYRYDNTLFAEVVVPPDVNKEAMIDTIMARCGDLYPYYQVPPQLKHNITVFFQRRYTDFASMVKALLSEYNPIHNYDRTETHTETHSDQGTENRSTDENGSDERNRSGNNSVQLSGTDSTKDGHTETTSNEQIGNTQSTSDQTNGGTDKVTRQAGQSQTTTGERTGQVSAYDADSFKNRDKENTSGSVTNSGTDTDTTTYGATQKITGSQDTTVTDSGTLTHDATGSITYGKKETGTHGDQEDGSYSKKGTDNSDFNRSGSRSEEIRAYGNIGVTTTQQMIEAEIDMRKKYDLYKIIAELFEDEFIVEVY